MIKSTEKLEVVSQLDSILTSRQWGSMALSEGIIKKCHCRFKTAFTFHFVQARDNEPGPNLSATTDQYRVITVGRCGRYYRKPSGKPVLLAIVKTKDIAGDRHRERWGVMWHKNYSILIYLSHLEMEVLEHPQHLFKRSPAESSVESRQDQLSHMCMMHRWTVVGKTFLNTITFTHCCRFTNCFSLSLCFYLKTNFGLPPTLTKGCECLNWTIKSTLIMLYFLEADIVLQIHLVLTFFLCSRYY